MHVSISKVSILFDLYICLFWYKDNIGFITIDLQNVLNLVSILIYLLKVKLAISRCLFSLQHKFLNESVQLYHRSSLIIFEITLDL